MTKPLNHADELDEAENLRGDVAGAMRRFDEPCPVYDVLERLGSYLDAQIAIHTEAVHGRQGDCECHCRTCGEPLAQFAGCGDCEGGASEGLSGSEVGAIAREAQMDAMRVK